MLRLAVKNFIHLCRRSCLFSILSGLCLFGAFVCFLILQEKGYYTYTVTQNQQMESQLLYLTSDDEKTIQNFYTELTNNPMLPSLGIVTISDEEYTGVYWNRIWNDDVWYTPYGRFFTTEEMEEGDYVALLGMSYIRQLPLEKIDTIWEKEIVINGIAMDTIGNYDDQINFPIQEETYKTQVLPTSIAIPLETFFKIGLSPTKIRVIFAEPLTNTQIKELNDLFQSIQTISFPKQNTIAVNGYISATVQYSLILILALLSIIHVLLYWMKMEFSRYKVYMICGAKRHEIIFLLSMNIALLITLTYIGACIAVYGLTKIIPAGIVAYLPYKSYCVIYIGSLFFSLVTVNIRAIPLVFHNKMYAI